MIGHLRGTLLGLEPGVALLEAAGVGYEIRVPLSAHALLEGQSEVGLWVHTHVREDQLALFGFPTREERDVFRLLLTVAGVGPRIALAVLSSMSPDELATSVEGESWRRLAAVPGIGKRTAERLVVELKGKISAVGRPGVGAFADAVSALVNLGYPVRDAEKAASDVLSGGGELELGELLRRALQLLAR